MRFQSVKGMDDLFFPEVEKWQALEQKSRIFLEAYGFREIRTPILESTELFARSIGEASDIVHKEMYTFKDRGDRSLTLRPEMTAGVVRAVLEHHLLKENEPLFVYYLGPMFRAERPQAGRKRQFHQIGVETLNTHSAMNDAELVVLIKNYLEWLGLKKYVVKINHLGSPEDRKQFSLELNQYFTKNQSKLCTDCQYRLSRNVLRIFDCKTDSCQPLIEQAPKPKLSDQAKSDFDKISSLLKDAKVPFKAESKLVRGLDYYTGFVFEVIGEGLGTQDAILAGGRYDSLIHDLGGPQVGASGFSIGTERLLASLEAAGVHLEESILNDTVYVAALVHGEETCGFYRAVAQALAEAGKRAHFSFSQGSISNHLGRASKMKAAFALIVGDDEWKAKEVTIKKMASGTQKRIKPEHLSKGFDF
ncbi:MAG: histidine--tRNA ligase [Omnitrophica bacterium RIFCSPHIGHO2_02_FULL_46_11]|nr:MAG: histidine--tRNA ligase [Omnitrophica bacterium RIFCSPHIGHO2_02_FULL_46_11]OGW87683.1 MAG: histidine--tRNA ligase [Omnitrophica bacterium RIFCSPLOWO2_01_FULL_45_10b]